MKWIVMLLLVVRSFEGFVRLKGRRMDCENT